MHSAARVGVGLLILALIGSGVGFVRAREELAISNARTDALERALHEANETIESLNDQINDAQALAGSDYEEMSDALESLDEGSTVDLPDE